MIRLARLPTVMLPSSSANPMAAALFNVMALIASSGSMRNRMQANESTKFILPLGVVPGLSPWRVRPATHDRSIGVLDRKEYEGRKNNSVIGSGSYVPQLVHRYPHLPLPPDDQRSRHCALQRPVFLQYW